MKKIIVIIISAVLILAGCSEAEVSDASDSLQEYQSKAHDALENYSDTIEESVDKESSAISESSSDNSDVSESSGEETSDESRTESDSVSIPDESEIPDKPVVAPIPEILLVTADIAYEDGTAATLVCGRDGSIDLYFANGYEMRNMGEKEDCREMSERLINACKEYFGSFEKVAEFPFPESGTTFIYLKTSSGFYRLGYDNTEILLGPEGDIEICVKNTITNITKYAQE